MSIVQNQHKNEYVIYNNDGYTKVKSKSDVIHLFPELKNDIHRFYKNNKSLRRLNYNQFLTELFHGFKFNPHIKDKRNNED